MLSISWKRSFTFWINCGTDTEFRPIFDSRLSKSNRFTSLDSIFYGTYGNDSVTYHSFRAPRHQFRIKLEHDLRRTTGHTWNFQRINGPLIMLETCVVLTQVEQFMLRNDKWVLSESVLLQKCYVVPVERSRVSECLNPKKILFRTCQNKMLRCRGGLQSTFQIHSIDERSLLRLKICKNASNSWVLWAEHVFRSMIV